MIFFFFYNYQRYLPPHSPPQKSEAQDNARGWGVEEQENGGVPSGDSHLLVASQPLDLDNQTFQKK